MPRTKTNYQNTVIYMIKCIDEEKCSDIYVGSTTNFRGRKTKHKSACTNSNHQSYNDKKYQVIRENGGWNEWRMLEVEKYPCNDKREAEHREEYWRLHYKASLNMVRCWTDGKCSVSDCENLSQKGGVCIKHGAVMKRCSAPDCENQTQKGGVCFNHGAVRKQCSVPDCENRSQKGGVCFKHGAVRKQCSAPDCENQTQKGGVCFNHGAVRKQCSEPGCENQSKIGGLCAKHQITIECSCGKMVKPSSMYMHKKSKYHLKNVQE